MAMHVSVAEGNAVDAAVKLRKPQDKGSTFAMIVRNAEDVTVNQNRLRERDKAVKA